MYIFFSKYKKKLCSTLVAVKSEWAESRLNWKDKNCVSSSNFSTITWILELQFSVCGFSEALLRPSTSDQRVSLDVSSEFSPHIPLLTRLSLFFPVLTHRKNFAREGAQVRHRERARRHESGVFICEKEEKREREQEEGSDTFHVSPYFRLFLEDLSMKMEKARAQPHNNSTAHTLFLLLRLHSLPKKHTTKGGKKRAKKKTRKTLGASESKYEQNTTEAAAREPPTSTRNIHSKKKRRKKGEKEKFSVFFMLRWARAGSISYLCCCCLENGEKKSTRRATNEARYWILRVFRWVLRRECGKEGKRLCVRRGNSLAEAQTGVKRGNFFRSWRTEKKFPSFSGFLLVRLIFPLSLAHSLSALLLVPAFRLLFRPPASKRKRGACPPWGAQLNNIKSLFRRTAHWQHRLRLVYVLGSFSTKLNFSPPFRPPQHSRKLSVRK